MKKSEKYGRKVAKKLFADHPLHQPWAAPPLDEWFVINVGDAISKAHQAALNAAAKECLDYAGEVRTFGHIPSDSAEAMEQAAKSLAEHIRNLGNKEYPF